MSQSPPPADPQPQGRPQPAAAAPAKSGDKTLMIVVLVVAGIFLVASLICAGLVVIMAGGLIYASKQQMPTYEPLPVYFYDLNTGQLFEGQSIDIPPIAAPSGSLVLERQPSDQLAGVKAYVYSCTDCDDADSQFVGWVEMYTGEVKAQLENPSDYMSPDPASMDTAMAAMKAFEQGHLIGEVADDASQIEWVPATSDEGFLLVQKVLEACGADVIPKPCMP